MAEEHQADGAAGAAGGGEAAKQARGLGSVLYKVGLAGVGALILAQEEIEAAWRRARGEKGEGAAPAEASAEAPEAKAADAEAAAAEAQAASRRPDGSRVAAQIDGAIGRMLRALDIPTRDEVDAVAARIEALTAKLDAREGRRA